VTLVTVNFNSRPQLEVLLSAVRRYTARPLEIVVVDNASRDGSRQFLSSVSGVRPLMLPVNIGHGPALDLGVLRAATSMVVVLDVDAFPVSDEWLPAVIDPLTDGAAIAGAHFHRGYIHPCFAALRRADFLDYRLSFVAVGRCPSPEEPATGLFLDVGESLSHILSLVYGTNGIHKIGPTSTRGPGMIGTVFGGVVYHNFYSTHGTGADSRAGAEAWQAAVDEYVGVTEGPPDGLQR